MKKSICLVIIFYFILALVFNFRLIMSVNKNSILMTSENAPISLTNYLKVMVGNDTNYAWNSFLSIPSWGLDILSYRFLFWAIGSLMNLELTQILILARIFFHFLAFIGAFLLSKDYLLNLSKNKWNNSILIASSIAGLVYGLNPSIMFGDTDIWIGIQFAFVSFPWIVWSFNKVILDKKWEYIVLCAFLMALNTDEHFIWAGFPIFLALYSGFFFIIKILKERKIDFSVPLIFLLLILIFSAMVGYRLIVRLNFASSYQFALTKAGVDVNWVYGSLLNMLRGMSSADLLDKYATSNQIFYFENSLMFLTLAIPILALLALVLYRKNLIVFFYGSLILVSTLPFFVGSPFKWMHYWIFFNIPFGLAFRTSRIPDSYVALSISVLMAFSLYHIFRKLSLTRKELYIPTIVGILLILHIYSWPLLTVGDADSRLAPIDIPNEYFEAYSFLSNQTGDFRVVSVPEFVYSYGKNTYLKPFWSPEWGVIQEFQTHSLPKPTFWPNLQWAHFYDFTLSPFYYSLLRAGDTDTLSKFIGLANVRYIVIHDDIPSMSADTKSYINSLNSSNDLKLVFNNTFIYIFENTRSKEKISVQSNTTLVSGGYRVVRKFYNNLPSLNDTYDFIFVDQGIPPEAFEKTNTILTDKSNDQLKLDLISSELVYTYPNDVIQPYRFTNEYDPTAKWSRASYLDPHQQEWHPYVNWQNYAWDFDYMKGLIFTTNSNDEIQIPIGMHPPGNYTLILRLLTNENGGKVQVDAGGKSLFINTYGKYNGFLWYKFDWILDTDTDKIKIKNVNGFNAVNLLALVPSDEFLELEKKTDKLSENKTILYLLFSEDEIHVANRYPKKDNSTNGSLILPPGAKVWQELKIIKEGYYEIGMKGEGKFNLTLDTSRSTLYLNNSSFVYPNSVYLQKGLYNITFEPTKVLYPRTWDFKSRNQIAEWRESTYELGSAYTVFWDEKEQALRAELSAPALGWRILSSPFIPVGYGGGYSFNFSIKSISLREIGFKIVEYDRDMNITHETTYSGGMSSTLGWRNISYYYNPTTSAAYLQLQIWDGNKISQYCPSSILIDNVTIVGDKSAYLDTVFLYSSDGPQNKTVEDLFKNNYVPPISFKKVNPTLWKVQVNASAPFMLHFSESYDPLWEAVVYKEGKKIEVLKPVPLYGVINGYWINQTGNIDIVVNYKVQDWFEGSLIISYLTITSCILYLFYEWRIKRGDKWAKNIETRFLRLEKYLRGEAGNT